MCSTHSAPVSLLSVGGLVFSCWVFVIQHSPPPPPPSPTTTPFLLSLSSAVTDGEICVCCFVQLRCRLLLRLITGRIRDCFVRASAGGGAVPPLGRPRDSWHLECRNVHFLFIITSSSFESHLFFCFFCVCVCVLFSKADREV